MGWREVLEQGLVSARSAKRAFALLLGVPTSKMDLIMVHHYKHETSKRMYSPQLGVRVHASLHPACTGAKRENSSSSVLISHFFSVRSFKGVQRCETRPLGLLDVDLLTRVMPIKTPSYLIALR